MANDDLLPEPLPDNPVPLFLSWYEYACAHARRPNPNAMVLATADAQGSPSARVVLCKHIEADPGYVVFFTNYQSRKGQELEHRPRAAVVFHWDTLHRQVRLEGSLVHSPAQESDDYFHSRPLASRIGAWASRQSQSLASRAALEQQVAAVHQRFPEEIAADAVPRPPHWGGYRLWIDRLELWVEGPGRVHERALWRRELQPVDGEGFSAGPWSGSRLNP